MGLRQKEGAKLRHPHPFRTGLGRGLRSRTEGMTKLSSSSDVGPDSAPYHVGPAFYHVGPEFSITLYVYQSMLLSSNDPSTIPTPHLPSPSPPRPPIPFATTKRTTWTKR